MPAQKRGMKAWEEGYHHHAIQTRKAADPVDRRPKPKKISVRGKGRKHSNGKRFRRRPEGKGIPEEGLLTDWRSAGGKKSGWRPRG